MFNCRHQRIPNSQRHILTLNTRPFRHTECTNTRYTTLLQGWSTNLCACLVTVTLLFQNLMFPLLPPHPDPSLFDSIFIFLISLLLFFCSTQPLRGYNHQHKSRLSQSIPVLCWCHRLSVPIFSCSDIFSWTWLFGAGIVGGVVPV